MAKNKFYVVWNGHTPGIYTTWDDCKKQVNGFKGAEYKGFPSLDIAEQEFEKRNSSENIKIINKAFEKGNNNFNPLLPDDIDQEALCVDGACSGNPGKGDYQCVVVGSKENIFLHTEFKETTNNLMEFFALVECLQYLTKHKTHNMTVYSDSVSAIAWVRNKKAKTTLKRTNDNYDTFAMLEKFENWLNKNDYSEVIIKKWNTRELGEIPADFGRK